MTCSDPFVHMERANKTYGFTIAVKELRETVPNIFRYASAYKRIHNIASQGLWEMFAMPAGASLPEDDPQWQPPKEVVPVDEDALPQEILNTEPGHGALPDVDPDAMEGETYNMCHFWSNFEIARLDWFRSKEYNEFFDMMDRSGGFWMERASAFQACIGLRVWLTINSGAMPLFTLSRQACCLDRRTSIISVILDIDILQYNIAQRMHPATDSWPDLHISSQQR